ncbi:PQQ-like beta-propeller repeat protein [candidate division KSB1 bacterium]|nr:PQQ-like beta-propeller repeat protein [candidate division KSB1 bacterium]
MTMKQIQSTFTVALACIGVITLVVWMIHDPVRLFTEFHPGLDNQPEGLSSSGTVDIGAFFALFAGEPSATIQSEWPRFRGADYDNISKEKIRLAEQWSESGPPQLWSVELGEGHSGPVVQDGRVYLLDYDEENRRDILRCFSLDDGQEIWQRGYDVFIKRNHGMSRTVPAVQDSYVVTIGPKCHVMCVTADSGRFKWGIDVEKEFESEIPLWYTGQCPLIDDSVAVIATGGKALLIGVHLETGEILWQTPNPQGWDMSHSSVMPMTLYGRRVYAYCALGGLVGVSADSGSVGTVLFQISEWSPSVIAPSPLHVGDNKIFVTAGYGAGSMLFQVTENNGLFNLELVQALKPEEGLCSEQQTPVLYDGHLFSILPKDAGPRRNQFVCSPAHDPGTILYASDRDARFGLGPYLMADGKFFILSDDGVLTLIKVSTTEWNVLDQAKVLEGHDAWGPMAMVQGRLLCRDSRRLVCLDVRAN